MTMNSLIWAKLSVQAVDLDSSDSIESMTALSTRLLKLQRASEEELLDDDTLFDYLDDFVMVCERQLQTLEDIGFCPASARGYSILRSFLNELIGLADSLDSLSLESLRGEIRTMESDLGFALYHLQGCRAA